MNRYALVLALAVAALAAQPWGLEQELTSVAKEPDPVAETATATATATATEIPPLPEGVAELRFADFFERIGRRGLELTDTLRALDQRRIRILGYMVRECDAPPGLFLLSPLPVTLHTHEYGLADDLPPATLHVQMPPGERDRVVPYTPGLLLLTGTLRVGSREEADGRMSCARLELDPPSGAPGNAALKLVVPPPPAPGRQGCCTNEDPKATAVPKQGEG